MKLSGNRLRMSSGEIRHFKSAKKRANFEKVAQAYKHGWKGPKKKGKRSSGSKHASYGGLGRVQFG